MSTTKPSIETIKVIFCTHLDIGYTDPPDRVAWKMKDYLDEALRLCDENPDFYYTVETAWCFRQWLDRTDDPATIERMVQRIREGRIEVCGAWTTMHSGVAGPEDLNQLVYDARRIQDRLGIEIITAFVDDVPGYCWAHPQILRKSGIKYLLAGVNTILGGGIGLPARDIPFNWEGVDGSQIFTYVQDGYCRFIYKYKYFEHLILGQELDVIAESLQVHLDDLKKAEYPYDTFCFIANPLDNRGPMENWPMFERMRQWNAEGRTPRFELSTPRRYFDDMQQRYGGKFPTHRGDWFASHAWNHVKVRGPLATQAYRHTQSRILSAEKLLALDEVLHGRQFPVADMRATYDNLLSYGEHSAPEGTGDNRKLTVREVFWGNAEHHNYAWRAWNLTEDMLELGQYKLAEWSSGDSDRIVVFNPLSWPTTREVRVNTEGSGWRSFPETHVIESLIDLETGETVPCDNITRSEVRGDGCGLDSQPCVHFLAKDVPPFGYKTYRVVRREDAADSVAATSDTCIENEKYRVEVNPATGIITSLFDKETRRELVNNAGTPERLFNDCRSATPVELKGVTVTRVTGKTFERIEIRRPGTWWPETDIRLAHGVDRIEIRNVFDQRAWKALHPHINGWSGVQTFPFHMDAEKAKVVVSTPNGHTRMPEDLLPGTPADTWPHTNFVALHDDESCVLIASIEDYLFHPGPKTGNLVTIESSALGQSFEANPRHSGKVMMPHIVPDGDGRIVRNYAIASHAGVFDARRANRFGLEFRNDLIGHYAEATPGGKATFDRPATSIIEIDDADTNILTFRHSLFAGQDYHILRLQELAGKAARTIRIRFAPELGLKWAAQADMVERKGEPIQIGSDGTVTVTIGPAEMPTLALGFEKKVPRDPRWVNCS